MDLEQQNSFKEVPRAVTQITREELCELGEEERICTKNNMIYLGQYYVFSFKYFSVHFYIVSIVQMNLTTNNGQNYRSF